MTQFWTNFRVNCYCIYLRHTHLNNGREVWNMLVWKIQVFLAIRKSKASSFIFQARRLSIGSQLSNKYTRAVWECNKARCNSLKIGVDDRKNIFCLHDVFPRKFKKKLSFFLQTVCVCLSIYATMYNYNFYAKIQPLDIWGHAFVPPSYALFDIQKQNTSTNCERLS